MSNRQATSSDVAPSSVEELAQTLRELAAEGKTMELGGNFTKRAMGGDIAPADVTLATRRLDRLLVYEPKDLTVSVEAGMTFRELRQTLAANNQMLPLDPPFTEQATVGGVIATNSSGPRRHRYGTARDMVIGLKMVTLQGKTVQSGGMVVKNVTGLDMAKLLIGSFGTLACVASVNFKVFPCPEEVRTFAAPVDSLEALLRLRRTIAKSVLQPVSLDILNARAVQQMGLDLPSPYLLLMEAGGNHATADRYQSGYEKMAREAAEAKLMTLTGDDAESLWRSIRNFTPTALAAEPETCVIRVSATASVVGKILQTAEADDGGRAAIVRSGVGYVYSNDVDAASRCVQRIRQAGLRALVEYAPVGKKKSLELWANPGRDLESMRRIKQTFDPNNLLNPGRLFQHI